MKPGDRVFWLRYNRELGSKTTTRVPAIFVGYRDKNREGGTVFHLDIDGSVVKKSIKLDNILPRNIDKPIDEAAKHMALYNGPTITPIQLKALEWLGDNSGLMVTETEMNGGRPKDWPAHRTFEGLFERGLIDVVSSDDFWGAAINDLGRSILRERSLA